MNIDKKDLKEWARQYWKGVQNIIEPSFTPDLKYLDEDGIRLDVQQSIKHGFFCTLIAPDVGLTYEEAKRFVEVVCDEAKDRILTSIYLDMDSIDESIDMLQFAESAGCHGVLLSYPASFYPRTEDEIYQLSRRMCDATNMAIVLYPTFKYDFYRFHPSGFPLDILEKMADFDNVIGMKIGFDTPGFIYECFRRLGKKILVNLPFESWLPITVREFGQQWIGASPLEIYQSPEKPYLVNYLNLLFNGETDKAMDIYWKLEPVRKVFLSQLMAAVATGIYHIPQQKYYQWLVGGNGGMTRQPVMRLYRHDMEACRNAMKSIGITPREPDEEFFVGRLNYAKQKKGQL